MPEDDSIPARQAAVDLVTRRFGADHRETPKARNLLGFALHRAGRPEEAEREQRTTLELCDEVLGARHPITSSCRRGLQTIQGH
ncbi:tetratricopeptide repeat protein [Amycolatopsis sp. lyj-90]|uniref:tetratricopeptide repeat protein n=1 Tax=Amycolatopsis sp. lyj-90 TaxID=2789285 RepID=UPI00397BC4D7